LHCRIASFGEQRPDWESISFSSQSPDGNGGHNQIAFEQKQRPIWPNSVKPTTLKNEQNTNHNLKKITV